MEDKYLQEKANCLRNEMNHLWGAIFITGGGFVGFSLVEEKSFLLYFYMILGFFWTMAFFNAYFIKRDELTKVVGELKKGGS